jgi:hypothetical protein
MAPKFSPGSKAYDRDGRAYVVEVADGGTVYCTSSNGVEMEFPESTLLSAAEWAVRADGRRDVSYARLIDNNDGDLIAGLSIIKSRAIFDEAKPEVRASLIAGLLSNRADTLISAVKLGDNLLRAMLDNGLAAHETAFEDFQDRPRR